MEGYEYCQCAKQYLTQRLETCVKDDRDLAAAMGYADFEKFVRHQDAWHALERPIPRRYLAAIGADVDVLRGALERDQVNFQLAAAMPRSTTYYTIRFMPTVYRLRFFEGQIPEEEAMRRVKAFVGETGLRCFLTYPELLTVYIEPDGSVAKRYYHPAIKITDNWVAIVRDGSRVGMAGI